MLFFIDFHILTIFGRLAFPIFAFQISEGYVHTKNLKKYFLRLGLLAVVSQIPFYLFHSTISNSFALNVLFTLFIGLLAIFIYDKISFKPVGLAIVFALSYIAELLKTDYGYFGVLLIFMFYLFKDSRILTVISYYILLCIKYVPLILNSNAPIQYTFLLFSTLSSIIPIMLYNKKQGKKVKYFLYIFYPVHLLALYVLHFFI